MGELAQAFRGDWLRLVVAALVSLLAGLMAGGLSACGNDGESKQPQVREQPFLTAMVPHHESAIEMASIAERRAEHREVKRLATNIVTAQQSEIAQMRQIHKRLFKRSLKPNEAAYQRLGLSQQEAGMAHMDMGELAAAKPFDRTFINIMIPHHQGAIRMARAVLATSKDKEIQRLARAIINAQSREIREMNSWHLRWYGSPSPAAASNSQNRMGMSGGEDDHGH